LDHFQRKITQLLARLEDEPKNSGNWGLLSFIDVSNPSATPKGQRTTNDRH